MTDPSKARRRRGEQATESRPQSRRGEQARRAVVLKAAKPHLMLLRLALAASLLTPNETGPMTESSLLSAAARRQPPSARPPALRARGLPAYFDCWRPPRAGRKKDGPKVRC